MFLESVCKIVINLGFNGLIRNIRFVRLFNLFFVFFLVIAFPLDINRIMFMDILSFKREPSRVPWVFLRYRPLAGSWV